MRESHEQLKITEAEWAAFCKDFDDTMAKFGVPDAEKNELFAIVQSTKGDIDYRLIMCSHPGHVRRLAPQPSR